MNDDTIFLEIDEDSTIGTRPHPGGGFILVVFTKDQKEVNLHFQPQFWDVIGGMFQPLCAECGRGCTHVGIRLQDGQRLNLCGACLFAGTESGKYQED